MTMAGDTYHWGDSVAINGGSNHTGIDKRHVTSSAAGHPAEELRVALAELTRLLQDLRPRLEAIDAEVIDGSLAELESGTSDPQRQRGILLTLAGIAATVGAVGQPVAEIISQLLPLVGNQ
ncbi:hypothetical protein [Streptomyces sp. JH34]|uniref:hypothetical protein n=1 Tax=unclassified Streptomyces TaxID=2593676 RepID=UPI0023F73440|nr:hypothetical protein [Streptomyces sp. JH34]MDF6023076.1 hypothetical protein [Streptomyces sp. JH34]